MRPNWASDDKGIFMGAFGVSLFILLTTLAVTFSQFLTVLHYVNVRLKMTLALLLPASLLAYRGGQRRRNLEPELLYWSNIEAHLTFRFHVKLSLMGETHLNWFYCSLETEALQVIWLK